MTKSPRPISAQPVQAVVIVVDDAAWAVIADEGGSQ
jgi:hypothetical protein